MNMLLSSIMGQGGQGGPFGMLNMSPEQMNQQFQQGVRDPAMLNFQRSTIPSIMQSFADQGASSGLYNSLSSAGRDLEQNLASQQMQFNQNQIQNLLSALGISLGTQTFQPYIKQGSGGLVPGAVNSFMNGMGQGAGSGPAIFGG